MLSIVNARFYDDEEFLIVAYCDKAILHIQLCIRTERVIKCSIDNNLNTVGNLFHASSIVRLGKGLSSCQIKSTNAAILNVKRQWKEKGEICPVIYDRTIHCSTEPWLSVYGWINTHTGCDMKWFIRQWGKKVLEQWNEAQKDDYVKMIIRKLWGMKIAVEICRRWINNMWKIFSVELFVSLCLVIIIKSNSCLIESTINIWYFALSWIFMINCVVRI